MPAPLLAIAGAALLCGLGRALRWLDNGAALAAFAVGAIVLGIGGAGFAVPLLVFFVTSSIWSVIALHRIPDSTRARTATRTATQVLANGSVAAALVVVFRTFVTAWPPPDSRCTLMLYLAALASVNADTWATEVGSLSRRPPRLLSDWKRVPAGTSGAVTPLGTLAAAVGAAVIPLSAMPLWHVDRAELIAVTWAGFLASALDSILGASLQAQYVVGDTRTPVDDRRGRRHGVVLARGIPWITNDTVNLLAGLGGVLFALLLLKLGVYRYY